MITNDPDGAIENEARRILVGHFHDVLPNNLDMICMDPAMLLNLPVLECVQMSKQEEHLNEMERALRKFFEHFDQLQLVTKKGFQEPIHAVNQEQPDRFKQGADKPDVDLSRLLCRFHYAMFGDVPVGYRKWFGEMNGYPATEGAIDRARHHLKEMIDVHHKAWNAEFVPKVNLALNARELWKEFNGADAPLKSEHGPFGSFVADLITHVGKDWSVEAVMRSYRKYEKRSQERKRRGR